MATFQAINLETSEVFQYEADTPQEIHRGEGWRLDQVFVSEASPDDPPPDPRKYGGRRRLSKLEFIDLLAWIRKMELATPEDDGTSINLDDPRTQGGVQALELIGLIGEGRAEEILNG